MHQRFLSVERHTLKQQIKQLRREYKEGLVPLGYFTNSLKILNIKIVERNRLIQMQELMGGITEVLQIGTSLYIRQWIDKNRIYWYIVEDYKPYIIDTGSMEYIYHGQKRNK